MNSPSRNREQSLHLKRKKTYDLFLRFLHWWNGILIICLMITIWTKGFLKQYPNGGKVVLLFHITLGYFLSGGLLARLLWGFFGPREARFQHMLFFQEWVNVLKERKMRLFEHWGHDVYASLAYLIFYACLFFQVVAGLFLAAIDFHVGPMLKLFSKEFLATLPTNFMATLHCNILYYFFMAFIVIHVVMLVVHEILYKIPVAQSMVSGMQYRIKRDDDKDGELP